MTDADFDLSWWLDSALGLSVSDRDASLRTIARVEDPESRIVRRVTPFPIGIASGLPFAGGHAALKPLRSIQGPLDLASDRFAIDIFQPVATVEVRDGAGTPALILTSARLPGSAGLALTRSHVPLEHGTVWIRANLAVAAAPSDQYIGVAIESGELTFPSPPNIAGSVIDVGGSLVGKLTLVLQQPDPLTGDAACAAAVSVEWPHTLTLTFSSGAPVSVQLDGGSADACGHHLVFDSTRSISYVSELGVLLFDTSVTPDRFDASLIESDLATFSGRVPIVRAGLAFTLTPSAVGESAGPFWLVSYDAGANASWIGAREHVTQLGPIDITLSPARFMLSARTARAQRPSVSQELALWQLRDNKHRLRCRVSFPSDFPFLFACDAREGEWIGLLGQGSMLLDRPIDADGQPVSIERGPALLSFQRQMKQTRAALLQLADGSSFATTIAPVLQRPVLLGLHNVLLGATPPLAAALDGTMSDESTVEQGKLVLHFGLYGWLPTLPDPYVANVSLSDRERRGFISSGQRATARFTAEILWSTTESAMLRFKGELGPSDIHLRAQTPAERRPARDARGPSFVATQSGHGSANRSPEEQRRFEQQRAHDLAQLRERQERSTALDRERNAQLESLFARVGPDFAEGFALLDVSTHADQIGVQFGRVHRSRTNPAAGMYVLDGLDLKTAAANVRVFALPQVQWEPVRTLDVDQDVDVLGYFPTPLASATDGGPSLFGVRSQRLVPTVPELVVHAVSEEFQDGKPVGLMTTLPFGIKAAVQLRPKPSGGQLPDMLSLTWPDFSELEARGSMQITAYAGRNMNVAAVLSPSFEGATVQFLNGVDLASGTPLGISVLGGTKQPASTIESMFNAEFAPGGSAPRVPVTRFDICGYGGTNFSDWANPFAAFATAAKVQFSVIVGRTSLEFVKFASVLYPWGIRVTRSVTVERCGGGGVIRRDSGWQPASDGLFDFSWIDSTGTPQPSPFVFHPGLLRGCFDIARLLPADGPIVEFAGDGGRAVKVAPLYFDASVHIHGAEADGERVEARGLLGYLHLEPPGVPLSPAELAQLIDRDGPIGGPIDCTLDAHRSGFRVRGFRMEVAHALEPNVGTRFVGAVRCVPQFVQSGSWSVVRMPPPGVTPGEATTIDDVRGLPMIRLGEMKPTAGKVDAPTGSDLRFADAEDLFRPNAPAFDYGLLQASSAHAFLFRRPHVAPGSSELRSSLVPLFADAFARLNSKGAFPPLDSAILLPPRSLIVNPTSGSFRLSAPINLPAPRGPLGSSPAGGARVRIFYDKATLQTDIQESSWSMDFTQVGIWTDMMGMEKFSGTQCRLVASNSERAQAREITTHFHPDFEDVLRFIPNFANRGVHGPVDLGASNEGHENRLTLEIHKKVTLVEPPPGWIGPKIELQLLYTFEAGVTAHENARHLMIGSRVGAELQAKLPLSAMFYIILGLAFEAGAKDLIADAEPATNEVELAGYIGFGMRADFAIAHGDAFLAVGVVVVIENGDFKAGGLVKLEAEVDLKVVVVQIGAELKGFLRDTKAPEPLGGKACDYKGEVGINVEICFVISIEFSHEFEGTKVL